MTPADVIENRARWHVHQCDAWAGAAFLDPCSVDAVVCDPPYLLGFMGKAWDSAKENIAANVGFWRCVLNALKPGGYLLAFGATRTSHRMVCAIEDAGFEIRDSIEWIYGSGYPKSLDVSKAIDAAAGAEREVVGRTLYADGKTRDNRESIGFGGCDPAADTRQRTAPATEAAKRWSGWGTALKPAHEPIVVARKPIAGTVAANVQEWGTGGLNVDGCRVGVSEADAIAMQRCHTPGSGRFVPDANPTSYGRSRPGVALDTAAGRWPPNLVLTHSASCGDRCVRGCPVLEMDEQGGERPGSPAQWSRGNRSAYGNDFHPRSAGEEFAGYGDSGTASRYFPVFRYEPKASRAERERGCEGLPAKTGAETVERKEGSAGVNNPRAGAGRTGSEIRNHHPTVKPVELMRWLCRLVTPPGGVVLDPFTGSGSTGKAAILEGFRFIGIEREAEYVEIAKARIGAAEAGAGPLFAQD